MADMDVRDSAATLPCFSLLVQSYPQPEARCFYVSIVVLKALLAKNCHFF